MGLGTGPEAPLFAPVEPARCGWLEVVGGHRIYFEEIGPADGVPVVFLHGGPGSGCNARQRQLFDPACYRAILVDQRGCGRSEPLGATVANTTADLVDDLEVLRRYLGIASWYVFGGSWGSTLALAYGQRHPVAVRGLVVRGIFLGTREEVDAYLAHPQFGAARQALLALLPPGYRGNPLPLLARLMEDERHAIPVAKAWLDYECAFMGEPPLAEAPNPRQMAKVRVQLHYLRNDCFLGPGELLAGVDRLRPIPGAIVQGLRDPVCPPAVAESLRRAWPEARWLPVPEGEHGGLTPPIAAACMAALDSLVASGA